MVHVAPGHDAARDGAPAVATIASTAWRRGLGGPAWAAGSGRRCPRPGPPTSARSRGRAPRRARARRRRRMRRRSGTRGRSAPRGSRPRAAHPRPDARRTRRRPSMLDLVDRVAPDLGHHVVDHPAAVFLDHVGDHVLEEAQHRVGRQSIGSMTSPGSITADWAPGRTPGSAPRLPALTAARAVSFRDASSAPAITSAMPTIESREDLLVAGTRRPAPARRPGIR